MKSTGGYNPIKWDCDHQGCWNAACRPPIHFFYDCFPRKISMTDVDATVEVNGHYLFMDWKSHDGELLFGQRRYFERLTRLSRKIICIIVYARQSPVDIEKIKIIYAGKIGEWETCTLEELHGRIAAWARRVDIKVVARGAA